MTINRRYLAALDAVEEAADAVGAYRRSHPESRDTSIEPTNEELELLAVWDRADDTLDQAREAWLRSRHGRRSSRAWERARGYRPRRWWARWSR